MHRRYAIRVLILLLLAGGGVGAADNDAGWIILVPSKTDAWQGPADDWQHVADVSLDDKNPRRLTGKPGEGVLVNLPKGSARNLVTRQKFADLEAYLEFNIPKGSNSGVKFMGLYEIQILDSFGNKALTGDDCGGIYPRAEEQPKYHHIDKGTAPLVNACKPPGEWQSLHVIFRAPRFDADGRKTAPARFVKVSLNGQLIHDNIEVNYPTGSAWRQRQEGPAGPLFLQGDHGPVAFRNVRVRPLNLVAK
jgi:hypothetical protein